MGEREVRKICSSISQALAQWKMAVMQGRLILDALSSSLYSSAEDKSDWQPAVQANILTLEKFLSSMKESVAQLEIASEKASGLEDLVNLSKDTSSTVNQSLNYSRGKAQDLLINCATSNLSQCSSASISLNSSTLLFPCSLTEWATTLLKSYRAQLDMNSVVVRTFCHLSSVKEAQYLTSVWTVQPSLDTEAQVAEVSVEATLKVCPAPAAVSLS